MERRYKHVSILVMLYNTVITSLELLSLQISHMFRCARIQGLDVVEGLLLFGKEHFYIVDNFTLLKSKEIADIDSLPEEYVASPWFGFAFQNV